MSKHPLNPPIIYLVDPSHLEILALRLFRAIPILRLCKSFAERLLDVVSNSALDCSERQQRIRVQSDTVM